MSDTAIAIVRWALLLSAVGALLQATVLYGWFRRRMLDPWLAANARAGAPISPRLRDDRMHRAWAVGMAIIFIALWWFLGTPTGLEFLAPRAP